MRRLFVIFIPFAIGTLITFVAQAFFSPVPVLVFKMDVGMAFWLLGISFSLLLVAAEVGRWRESRAALKKLEDARRADDASRRRFIRRLDHEIKNPLTGLRAALVNLREPGSESEHDRAQESASRSVERLTRLLSDLRKLAELEERPLERLVVDVPSLLEEMVAAAQSLPQHAGRNVSLLIARVPPLSPVTGDPDLLGLAVYNLIDNALKFTAAFDPVEVRAREDGKSIIIEVADSGPGIPSDDLPGIFEELYRGANARGIEGSGLGLALVRRIVALHGGEISVRSRQDASHGTLFTVRLPVRTGV